MRVQRRFIRTTNIQVMSASRAVRERQNPLPRKWFDHHGRTSRNGGRSNEAGEAARNSER